MTNDNNSDMNSALLLASRVHRNTVRNNLIVSGYEQNAFQCYCSDQYSPSGICRVFSRDHYMLVAGFSL